MALSKELGLLILFVVLLVLIVAIFWARSRSKKRIKDLHEDPVDTEDDAFNIVNNTEGILRSFRNKGLTNPDAERLLIEARKALEVGSYFKAKSLAEDCKRALKEGAKLPLDLYEPTKSHPQEDNAPIEPKTGNEDALISKRPVKPEGDVEQFVNFDINEFEKQTSGAQPARFTLKMAQDFVEETENEGKDTGNAMEFLDLAEDALEKGNYDLCISLSMKAKKCAQGEEISLPKEDMEGDNKGDIEEDVEEEAEEQQEYPDTEEEPFPSSSKGSPCPECGNMVDIEDRFCGKCGVEQVRQVLCPECGAKAEQNDSYCRKCGSALGEEVFICPECSEEVPSNSSSCPNCGQKFQE